ncbi:MAG TPA: carboxypeptidase-like regulatory domain-containing protein [Gemmataceae bacterium]|nr:carboxypeptidase-like regulatory domain-containing protein [Gemmataceae bacterium]
MRPKRLGLAPTLVATAAVLLAGCPAKPPKTAAVHGRVVFLNGAPVPNASVQFIPKSSDQTGWIANATTGPDGTFDLTTFDNYTHTTLKGAVPGKYKVTVQGYPRAVRVPAMYAKPTDTPFEVEVPEAGKQDVDLRVDPNFG